LLNSRPGSTSSQQEPKQHDGQPQAQQQPVQEEAAHAKSSGLVSPGVSLASLCKPAKAASKPSNPDTVGDVHSYFPEHNINT
jgi:hypothetical protein